MKKVLIISYYYPPANFAGSYRIQAWANELLLLDFKPIVVTRHWNANCTDFTSISDQNSVSFSLENQVEVYRVPYKGTFRDKLKKKQVNLFGLEKIFSFFNLFFSIFILKLNPAYSLYRQAEEILKNNPDIRIVVTSGRPFYQFQYVSKLKSKFPYISCIGDYRDPWNTNTNINSSVKRKFFKWFEKSVEKRTTNSFSAITTCSEGFKRNISLLIKDKPIYVITNGFNSFNTQSNINKQTNKFEIAFIGSLYENQMIETFLIPLINSSISKKIKIIFYGISNQPEQKKRIIKIIQNTDLETEVKPWMKKNELLKNVINHDAFLLCGLKTQKGRHTAKFFDYLSFKKNIILCPSDEDVLENEIKRLKIGKTLPNEDAVTNWILELNDNNFVWPFIGNLDEIEKFTYKNQVKKLADIINYCLDDKV